MDGGLSVLDIYCGARPYEDLLPDGSRCTGLDIDDRYGFADVVSDEFLPFPDESFDLVMCTEAFQYVPDPAQGIAEIMRVLRPGGRAIITVSLVWQYDRTILEHRYTGPELAALFADWDDVEVVENGGYAVAWATLTGRILSMLQRAVARSSVRRVLSPAFSFMYLLINGLATGLGRLERRHFVGRHTLPMNLRVTGRRPMGATREPKASLGERETGITASRQRSQYAPSTPSAGSSGPIS
jgi:SAM-dependent methyltransferase